jgi:hypothetical protein
VLEPFANVVRKFEDTPEQGTTVTALVRAARARARKVLAREIGRRADAFPVLSRFDADAIVEGASGNASVLGGVVFPPLRTCYLANVEMRARASQFVGVADVTSSDPRPERALADKVAGAAGHSVWAYWVYVERAAERVVSRDDHVGRHTVDEVAMFLRHSEAATVTAIAQGMGETLVLGAADLAWKKMVPVVNVATAAWHIATAVTEFTERSDEFNCTLDPRDALVDAAPSVGGLALDIAVEAVFAVL